MPTCVLLPQPVMPEITTTWHRFSVSKILILDPQAGRFLLNSCISSSTGLEP